MYPRVYPLRVVVYLDGTSVHVNWHSATDCTCMILCVEGGDDQWIKVAKLKMECFYSRMPVYACVRACVHVSECIMCIT